MFSWYSSVCPCATCGHDLGTVRYSMTQVIHEYIYIYIYIYGERDSNRIKPFVLSKYQVIYDDRESALLIGTVIHDLEHLKSLEIEFGDF